jgi:hypothetical protein
MKSFREFMIGEARILDRQEAIQKAIDFGPSNLYDRKDIDIKVAKVPLPLKGTVYDIANYLPVVKGLEVDYVGPVGEA